MNKSSHIDSRVKSNLLIIGGFLFYYLDQVLFWAPGDIVHGINKWAYTDWLIDYSSGFVRRGLSGEIIDSLSIFLQPRVSISITAWGIFTLVVLGYLRLIMRSIEYLSPFVLTALLFLPSLLPFYLYDHGAFGRKEILGFLLLFLHLYGLESMGDNFHLKKYIKTLIPITLILLPAQMLIHENTLLLFVPIHLMISFSVMRYYLKHNFKKIFSYLIALYSPIFLIFIIIIMVTVHSQTDGDRKCNTGVPINCTNF